MGTRPVRRCRDDGAALSHGQLATARAAIARADPDRVLDRGAVRGAGSAEHRCSPKRTRQPSTVQAKKYVSARRPALYCLVAKFTRRGHAYAEGDTWKAPADDHYR